MMRFNWHQDEQGVYICELPDSMLRVYQSGDRWLVYVEPVLSDIPDHAEAPDKETAMKLGASWYHLYRALMEWPYDTR